MKKEIKKAIEKVIKIAKTEDKIHEVATCEVCGSSKHTRENCEVAKNF